MNEAFPSECVGGAIPSEGGQRIRLGAVAWLSFAAAPTFAVMALLTGVFDGDASDVLCSAAHGALPFSGMAVMYVLMAVFHSAPWLKLISGWRGGTRRLAPAFAGSSADARSLPLAT